MPKRKKEAVSKPNKTLDTFSEKRPKGRPRKIPLSWVLGRAGNYRNNLAEVWARLREPLLVSTSEAEVIAAFENHAQPYAHDFVPRLASDILQLIRDPKFPKRPEPQISFLAESLGGRPNITPRTSRDICGKERATQRAEERARSPHQIVRREFHIECSCGHKGPARDDACPECGAKLPPPPEPLGRSRVF
jgi:hypothetical protein